jgi:hypothetical protein
VSLLSDDYQDEYDGSPDSVHTYIFKIARERFDEGRQRVLARVTGLAVPGIVARPEAGRPEARVFAGLRGHAGHL